MRTYEAMLLVEPTIAAKDWPKVTAEVDRIAKRNGANVVSLTKWGERKLFYPVRKNNRGTYVLTYLQAEEKSVPRIRSDFQLSEIVLRNLVLRHEGEPRKEPPKDFETAGLVPRKGPEDLGGDDRGPRSYGPPRM